MGYKALYRSYRPTTFKEVIGQKHVIQTLKNAIIENRTSHAYVFSGLRGIGKTTIARILAKAVNCQNPIDGEPCNECENCKAINENITTDVVELDAASNNGVDEIRSLLEKVNFLPSFLSKKVYIIDEVHMLSTAAFNALLKTLEEPPAYVMFILATTEPHKIPMTILSRCQRFDFKQLTIAELTLELVYICEKENIQITKEALNGIAEAAEGGMRDALSILDQASVYAENEITVEDVNSVTGNISNQKIIELLHALNNDDATAAISNINELLNMGKEVSRLITNVIQFCRDLLLFKSVNEAPTDKYIYTTEEFASLVEETDSKRLFYYIDVLVDVQNKIRFTNSQKIYLEVGIMKIVNSASEDIDLLGRIQALEYRLNNGEGADFNNTYIPSNSSFEQRISTIENKIKKLYNEIEKANIIGFEETINSKIGVLEDVVSKTSALPNTIEQRITILENRLEDLETEEFTVNSNNTVEQPTIFTQPVADNKEFLEQLNKIESDLNDYIAKTNAILTAVVEDLENLKDDDNCIETGSTNVNDEVILELIDKITQIEEKVNNIQTVDSIVPNNNSEIVGELRNGPIGAEFIGVEGQWTKVKCGDGETGYIRSSLLQNTPTKPVNIDPGFIAGAWRIEGAMWGGHCDYIVFTDGTYGYYNDSFCEGGISHAGKWHLEESRIVFTQVYSFVNGEVERTISRYNIDVEKHQIESEGTIYKRAYYTPAQLEAYRKWVKPYVNL